jgi:hypothetical protein
MWVSFCDRIYGSGLVCCGIDGGIMEKWNKVDCILIRGHIDGLIEEVVLLPYDPFMPDNSFLTDS